MSLLNRSGHVAVLFKDALIIWGGNHNATGGSRNRCDPTLVTYHKNGEWYTKHTFGDIPKSSANTTAVVINDNLFIVGGYKLDNVQLLSSLVYSLDLTNWKWTMLAQDEGCSVTFVLPCFYHTSWVYDGNIYLFGEAVYPSTYDEIETSMGLFRFSLASNQWERLLSTGDIPSPRYGYKTIMKDDQVFLFGGFVSSSTTPPYCALNDLYMLDMTSLQWKLLHGPTFETETLLVPRPRVRHTLTVISESTAVLIGGFNNRGYNKDCWLLDLEKARRCHDPPSMWIRFRDDTYMTSARFLDFWTPFPLVRNFMQPPLLILLIAPAFEGTSSPSVRSSHK